MNYKIKMTTGQFLIAATILKVVVIIFFFQHIIDYKSSPPRIVSGYGWDQLVSSMYRGKYEMVTQSGLSDIYDLKSYSYRPPIYPLFLFITTCLSNYSAVFIVFLQSIITSLVAYFGYKIVILSTSREKPGIICLWTLFVFPMNFLKSGTIDEAPLMLVFLLASLYIICKYMRNQDRLSLLFLSGALLGLSTLTRFTTLPIALGISLLMLSRAINGRYRKILLFIFAYLLVLSPWVFRNYLIYNELILTSGSGRILLFTQSEEFIESFAYESPDSIERRFLRSFHKSHEYLSELDSISLDKEFKRFAISEAINFPQKYCRAFISKLKPFVPYRYFSLQDRLVKEAKRPAWARDKPMSTTTEI
ncbi:MAG: glycosyltransferase family 39 protein, partial [Candidatus Hodarchaeota archaeon]